LSAFGDSVVALGSHGPVFSPNLPQAKADLCPPGGPSADTLATTPIEAPGLVAHLTRVVENRLQAGSSNLHDEVIAVVERHLILYVVRHTGGGIGNSCG
jgi:hypothetical protein